MQNWSDWDRKTVLEKEFPLKVNLAWLHQRREGELACLAHQLFSSPHVLWAGWTPPPLCRSSTPLSWFGPCQGVSAYQEKSQ